jgi:glycosyltransferase involved in cell wall biosynthesis
LRRWYLPLMPWAVRSLRVGRCDLLISTSSAVMKSIRPPPGTPHLCYCHSPARYVWEQSGDYAGGAHGRLRSWGLGAARRPFQDWDRRTASRVTQFLANSTHTAERIRRCYGREARIVHPPVRTEFFTPDPTVAREDWLLVVAAHEPYKRTDVVIQAARKAGFALKVAGGGSQWDSLRAMAAGAPNIQMLGRVDDLQLRDLLRRAQAMVQMQAEDFGIAAVEALACGCPVLAFGKGGVLDIHSSRTGILFEEQSPEALVTAIETLGRARFDPADCRANALRFTEASFDQAIRREAASLLERRGC